MYCCTYFICPLFYDHFHILKCGHFYINYENKCKIVDVNKNKRQFSFDGVQQKGFISIHFYFIKVFKKNSLFTQIHTLVYRIRTSYVFYFIKCNNQVVFNLPNALYLNWHIPMHKVLGGLGGKMIRVTWLEACCNYLSQKKKKKVVFNHIYHPYINVTQVLSW